jgi:hypothetical protein
MTDTTPRTCRTCGVVIPPRAGKGAPFLYCVDHAPANRTAAAKWYAAHASDVAAYQRTHSAARETVERVCIDCAAAFRTWSGAVRCLLCRSVAKRAATWQAKFEATVPIICPECRGVCPPYAGRLRDRTYCSSKCRQRHDDRNRTPRNRATTQSRKES